MHEYVYQTHKTNVFGCDGLQVSQKKKKSYTKQKCLQLYDKAW